MEIIALLAALTLCLLAAVVMMGLGIPFRVNIHHEYTLPPAPVPPQVVETEEERRRREKDMKQDIVSALNGYFFDRADDSDNGGK